MCESTRSTPHTALSQARFRFCFDVFKGKDQVDYIVYITFAMFMYRVFFQQNMTIRYKEYLEIYYE